MDQLTVRKILIANRGELVSRVARTCRKLGIKTVGVYSDADAGLPYLRDVNESVCIGKPPASESYLNVEKLIVAAKKTGCDAVHPGWGFLAESAEFAEAVTKNGLMWIGPTAESIRRVGDKESAKREAEGITPVIPGTGGRGKNGEQMLREAKKMGFPVLLKASAGGGGKGQRVVREEEEWQRAWEGAQTEARNSFGDDSMLLEKYVERGRHVEVQIVGDQRGEVRAFGDRDCSVQRRRQKIVEECPCVLLGEQQRREMQRQAEEMGKRVGYVTTGTVEFLVDLENRQHYFLEVNTRLQVEHTVTEMVYGVDLVLLQIATASGLSLDHLSKQGLLGSSVPLGHAIQMRICMEDASKDFAPSVGKIVTAEWPRDVRLEVGVESGSVVSTWYDSMISKIIAYGATRDACIVKAMNSLEDTIIVGEGVPNVKPIHMILDSAAFRQNTHYTTWLQPWIAQRYAGEKEDSRHHVGALIVQNVSRAHRLSNLRNVKPKEEMNWPGRLLLHKRHGSLSRVEYRADGQDSYRVRVDGTQQFSFTFQRLGDGGVAVEVDNVSRLMKSATWSSDDGKERVCAWSSGVDMYGAHKLPKTEWYRDTHYERSTAEDSANSYICNMPATILALSASSGDKVQQNSTLLVMESMKMEIKITAHKAGVVHYLVSKGDIVKEGTLLCEVK